MVVSETLACVQNALMCGYFGTHPRATDVLMFTEQLRDGQKANQTGRRFTYTGLIPPIQPIKLTFHQVVLSFYL